MAADPLEELARMSADLERLAAEIDGEGARLRPPDGSFAFVEHVWHLADLENEGFAERIRRLRTEEDPALSDFDGAKIARERDYRSRDVAQGLAAFGRARAANLASLRALTAGERARSGRQQGVGPVSLGDIPGRMLEHDRSHRRELDALVRYLRAERAAARE